MKINLYIEVRKKNNFHCDINCPFIDCGYCVLFNVDLTVAPLPENYEYQGEPDYQRCFQCLRFE
jgi:hypothetical protein